jgi:hypothetical protein
MATVKNCRTPISIAKEAIKDGVKHHEYSDWCRAHGFMPVNAIKWDMLKNEA